MLKEIRCSEFKTYGEPRKPIEFHEGLNAVIGGQAAENSIGKSTFLLIVDYCFGGETYAKDSTKDKIGNHVIEFVFEFSGKKYRYSRDVLNPRVVNVLDPETREFRNTMKINEFTEWLQDMYGMDYQENSFRFTTSRFFRVAAKKNDSPDYPLSAARGEKVSQAFSAIEKLFYLNRFVDDLKLQLKDVTETQKAIRSAQKKKIISDDIRTEKQFEKNQAAIERLEKEIEEFVQESDEAELGRELGGVSESAQIRSRISSLKREFRMLNARHKTILSNLSGNREMQDVDLDELRSFFPDINMEKIENVQMFHKRIYGILEEELKEEADSVYSLIQAANAEIRSLEQELISAEETSKISPDFLARYSEYQEQLSILKAQGDVYKKKVKAKEDKELKEKDLDEEEISVLQQIEAKLNSEMTRISDEIDFEVEPPAIHFDGRKSYVFESPSDHGTGTAYKNLIILDLAFLHLTPLPALVHDSSMFKNVADFPVDKIMKMYSESSKQIFIAFDKENAYSEATQAILEKAKVLQLDEGGNELFGWSWKKKVKAKK